MGGIIFFLPLIFFLKSKLYLETILIISYFLVGLTDDILKIRRKNFSIRSRLWFEFLPIFFYLLYKIKTGELNPIIRITPSWAIQLSYYTYVMLTGFIFVGIVNSFNITDGIDGLLGSLTTQIIVISFILLAKFNINHPNISNSLNTLLGYILAYLIFNFPPAKTFMGNVGSVTLGAIIATIYVLYNLHILLLVICAVFVINTISVIIQSFSYRVLGKRVLPIAPLHHTLEFQGFNSLQIDLIYFLTNLTINGVFFIFLLKP